MHTVDVGEDSAEEVLVELQEDSFTVVWTMVLEAMAEDAGSMAEALDLAIFSEQECSQKVLVTLNSEI